MDRFWAEIPNCVCRVNKVYKSGRFSLSGAKASPRWYRFPTAGRITNTTPKCSGGPQSKTLFPNEINIHCRTALPKKKRHKHWKLMDYRVLIYGTLTNITYDQRDKR